MVNRGTYTCWSTVWLLFALFAAENRLTAQATHTQASLLLDVESIRPGGSFLAGVRLKMDAGWHTYWRNPGASGMATAIEWTLPDGITAGPILWPVPQKLPEDELTTYIYEDEVILLVPLQLATNAAPGRHILRAKVSWLECKVQCLPGEEVVETTLHIGNENRPSKDAELLRSWQKRLPQLAPAGTAKSSWGPLSDDGKSRAVLITWSATNKLTSADFFPYQSDDYQVEPATTVNALGNGVELRKIVRFSSGKWPETVSGVLISGSGTNQIAYEVQLDPSASANTGNDPASIGTAALPSLWQMLLYAFIGGLILNIMPCVLPVIALKILGFVGQARDEPKKVRRMGLVYALGVVISFLGLAALVIGVKAAGHQAGWGMQFGNPQFLVVLTVIVTLVALNLFGLFEVTPGGKIMDAADGLASQHGYAGAFFNGVLATVLATPCTAPFLGVALGFAFAQGTGSILLMFTVVALGLAFPYVLLSWQPSWLKFLPKPGNWMERFKVLMGFPLLATAVWTFSLTSTHYGNRTWWLAIFLVLLSLAAYIYGEFVQRARTRPALVIGIIAVLLTGAYFYVLEGQLQWRSPVETTAASGVPQNKAGGIQWQAWSPEAVEEARAAGRIVLVDFTADWCVTCQANKKFALEVPSVQKTIEELNVVPLLGDYTRLPANITRELNKYGRAGVPLVLVFPPGEREVIVLPEALLPGIVLEALAKAARNS